LGVAQDELRDLSAVARRARVHRPNNLRRGLASRDKAGSPYTAEVQSAGPRPSRWWPAPTEVAARPQHPTDAPQTTGESARRAPSAHRVHGVVQSAPASAGSRRASRCWRPWTAPTGCPPSRRTAPCSSRTTAAAPKASIGPSTSGTNRALKDKRSIWTQSQLFEVGRCAAFSSVREPAFAALCL